SRGGPGPAFGAGPANDPASRAARADRHAARGPPLVGRRKRGVPDPARGGARRDTRASRGELPARVPGGLDATVVLPATAAPAARHGGDRRVPPGGARAASFA